MKIECPHEGCGKEIEVKKIGVPFNCPHCGGPVKVKVKGAKKPLREVEVEDAEQASSGKRAKKTSWLDVEL